MIRATKEHLTAALAAASILGVVAMPADAQPKYNEVKPTSERPWVSAHDAPYRTDEVMISLPGNGARGGELEWKVRMKAGATMIYSWSESGTPADEFYSDLHGHATVASPNGEFDLANYHKGTGDKHAGAERHTERHAGKHIGHDDAGKEAGHDEILDGLGVVHPEGIDLLGDDR